MNIVLAGRGEQMIGVEKVERSAVDLMILGPGIPHYGYFLQFPVKVIVVHFLPVLLFELGPAGDGARILSRFTAARTIAERIVRPPKASAKKLARYFEEMAREFESPQPGAEFFVRARLMDALVEVLRWEDSTGDAPPQRPVSVDWPKIDKALHFIYRHYTEPIYIGQIARAAGMSAENLHTLFHDTFGMTCVQYLCAYRISHAASLLGVPGARVAEVAFATGFETLSYFNKAFRRYQGMSPRDYIQSRKPTA